MTPQDKLDYALGLLDGPQRDRFDREIEADPELARSLEQIRTSLAELLDDGEALEPPSGLARRTILRVEVRRRPRTWLDYVPNRVNLRWADFAVAASILVAGLLTLLPAVQRSQLAARSAACTANLRELGVGLIRYAGQHNGFPYPDSNSPAPWAGAYAIHLRESGLLQNASLLDCPSNGRNPLPPVVPCFDDLKQLKPESRRGMPCLQHNDYAYALGFRRAGGWPVLAWDLPQEYPLLADRPPHDHSGHSLDGNSPNHHGAGQYVLFVGGHVRFLPTRRLFQDADIFRNNAQRTEPGLQPRDYVLATGIRHIGSW